MTLLLLLLVIPSIFVTSASASDSTRSFSFDMFGGTIVVSLTTSSTWETHITQNVTLRILAENYDSDEKIQVHNLNIEIGEMRIYDEGMEIELQTGEFWSRTYSFQPTEDNLGEALNNPDRLSDLSFTIYGTEYYHEGTRFFNIQQIAEIIIQPTSPVVTIDFSDIRVYRGNPITVDVTLTYPDNMFEDDAGITIDVSQQTIHCLSQGNGSYTGTIETFDLEGNHTAIIDILLWHTSIQKEQQISVNASELENTFFGIPTDILLISLGLGAGLIVVAVGISKQRAN